MEAVIVAAGKGTRLGQIGKQTPKCLLRIAGFTLLERQIRALERHGIQRVTVVIGHRSRKILLFWQQYAKDVNIEVRFVINPDYENTGGGFSFLLGVQDITDDVLYLIGDMIYETELINRLQKRSPKESGIRLGVQIRPTASEDMKVSIQETKIVDIGKDLDPEQVSGEFVGAAFIKHELLPDIKQIFGAVFDDPSKMKYHFGNAVRELIHRNYELDWVDLSDLLWSEIDCIHDLRKTRAKWKDISE